MKISSKEFPLIAVKAVHLRGCRHFVVTRMKLQQHIYVRMVIEDEKMTDCTCSHPGQGWGNVYEWTEVKPFINNRCRTNQSSCANETQRFTRSGASDWVNKLIRKSHDPARGGPGQRLEMHVKTCQDPRLQSSHRIWNLSSRSMFTTQPRCYC